ncbi:MAG: hypothetical protein GYB31_03520 [Bacteroidetes bacterium]|nr:hypothetical protein [Bacteroidota bacterium]
MRNNRLWLLCLFGAFVWTTASAHIDPNRQTTNINEPNSNSNTAVSFRADCTTAGAQIDQGVNRLTGGKVNNVRARLTTGGDVWWDRGDGLYVVPHVDPGQPEVSSIFAGAVWLGGLDPGGSLKVAGQTYGNAQGNSDFWAGPLDPVTGLTDLEICDDWDRFFEVYASEIDLHLSQYEEALAAGEDYDPDMIPEGVKGWPARGNDYFFEINEFELPNTTQGLAGYYDRDGNMKYEPAEGDYPIIEIRGCEDPQYPDQMIFWIYNDAGGIHAESNADAIQMEVQVQAFSYGTNDQINDMTFQRYKLINRAIEDIDSTFFAIWVDADLGCYTDDYVGCDTSRSLAYTYNADAADGNVGTTCPDGINTYGTEIPIIGVDYFRGPLKPIFDANGEPIDTIELGMSSFTYFNNPSQNAPPTPTTDPANAEQFYNYLSGSWRDGTPFTYGGDGYGGTDPIDFAFTEDPNNQQGWSMCTESLPEYDRRTVQASGPFLLKPGATNELIIGAVWVPELDYPCPDISRLFQADNLAQNLFDNCFDILDGPDAPDLDFIELDQSIIAVLSNDTLIVNSNNAYEMYEENDLEADASGGDIDSTYNFEGYVLYQLAGPEVTTGDYDNTNKARIVAQVDLKNGVSEIFNWTSVTDPGTGEDIWYPELVVQGPDEGIRHTFEINTDLFASGDNRLINHKKYYYSVIAYAYNNWQQYDADEDSGQKRPYIVGRRNIKTYTVIPRPIVDRELNSFYGDGPVITRIDGVGVGNNFVDLDEATKDAILKDGSADVLTYQPGQGPINVKVYNPLDVVDGEFLLTLVDENMGNSQLDTAVYWQLENLSNPSDPIITSDQTIDQFSEQVLAKYGITVTVAQAPDVGSLVDEANGAIGAEYEYGDPSGTQWFFGLPDDFNGETYLNYVATAVGEPDNDLDPGNALNNIGDGGFVPFQLADYRNRTAGSEYVTPGWRNSSYGSLVRDADLLANTNNVDIVFTSDKSLWSRCVIVETANPYYTSSLGLPTDGSRDQFDLRAQASVSKDDTDGDGLPDPDGATDFEGDPTMGMGWFPGYAIDVETGERLNIFFGENSAYSIENAEVTFPNAEELFLDGVSTAGDMMFNPTSQVELFLPDFTTIANFIGGGQHFVYVSNTPYNGCEDIYKVLKNPAQAIQRVPTLRDLTWAGWPMMAQGTRMTSYSEGLIPNDLTIKLRVNNPYQVETATGEYDGYPTYRFVLDGQQADELSEEGVTSALDMINVVPNPYYAFSDYEGSQFNTTVKITNLPAKCVVTIYSLDGKFIRQYNRDESGAIPEGNNRGIQTAQYAPDIEWDLKNNKAIPIAAGVYLIHVDAGELGERVIKWFGTNRAFDPSGL